MSISNICLFSSSSIDTSQSGIFSLSIMLSLRRSNKLDSPSRDNFSLLLGSCKVNNGGIKAAEGSEDYYEDWENYWDC